MTWFERFWNSALRQIQVERRFGRLALQYPEPPGQRPAQLRVHLALHFVVTPRLGRLALQRIHLPADFFENVEDAREILLGAFEFRFGQTLRVLNLLMPAASSMMARRSCGLELRICPMRPCSMMA